MPAHPRGASFAGGRPALRVPASVPGPAAGATQVSGAEERRALPARWGPRCLWQAAPRRVGWGGGAGAAASPPRGGTRARGWRLLPAQPGPAAPRSPAPPPCPPGLARAPCSAWWSSSSWRLAWRGSRCGPRVPTLRSFRPRGVRRGGRRPGPGASGGLGGGGEASAGREGRWGPRSLRQLQSFNSTVCRMPARMPCWWVFQLEVTPSGSLDPVLYSEDSRREVR
ncbi:guanine nucleotide-binding protein G(I)/G(S)/G(O) subunit gamma-10 isoform X1 [Pan paniscus]|uniref:guanine nucleotide-binding protein G(I)/G(S)/G(O) subunit gamma-10 isoform X1 n=1 Tax=Pan paniscus TaxID=9597 RepID=UPI00300649DB